MMQDVPGLEEEINHNAVYIRYSAQKSFDASLEAVHGLLSGEMDETQAFDTLRSVMNRKDPEKKATVNFENEYSISLNDRNSRDAASSILTTIREEKDAQLALAPYYYFTSSMYKGECTSSRVGMMTAKSSDTALYYAKINGKQVYELVENYLADADENFYVTNKYELPIVSGMKMISTCNKVLRLFCLCSGRKYAIIEQMTEKGEGKHEDRTQNIYAAQRGSADGAQLVRGGC